MLKHRNAAEDTKADGTATTSLVLGISAFVFILLGILIGSPVVFLLSVPTSIVAIILGSNAQKAGTTKTARARVGGGLGWGALGAAVGILIFLAIVFASWN
jgi:hypothetical protein